MAIVFILSMIPLSYQCYVADYSILISPFPIKMNELLLFLNKMNDPMLLSLLFRSNLKLKMKNTKQKQTNDNNLNQNKTKQSKEPMKYKTSRNL